MISFTRSATDSAEETLTIVQCDNREEFYCDALSVSTPYLVEVTSGDELIGLYDLDGEKVDRFAVGTWEHVDSAPADVIAQVEEGWATGNFYVTRNA